jgi:hypothetical protein
VLRKLKFKSAAGSVFDMQQFLCQKSKRQV